jgi:hypothetical protein
MQRACDSLYVWRSDVSEGGWGMTIEGGKVKVDETQMGDAGAGQHDHCPTADADAADDHDLCARERRLREGRVCARASSSEYSGADATWSKEDGERCMRAGVVPEATARLISLARSARR